MSTPLLWVEPYATLLMNFCPRISGLSKLRRALEIPTVTDSRTSTNNINTRSKCLQSVTTVRHQLTTTWYPIVALTLPLEAIRQSTFLRSRDLLSRSSSSMSRCHHPHRPITRQRLDISQNSQAKRLLTRRTTCPPRRSLHKALAAGQAL